MDVDFDYDSIGDGLHGKIYRPVAKVTFKSPITDSFVSSWMVVDSGADQSILPKSIALRLNISLKKDCVKEVTIGVGGRKNIYFMKNKIQATIGHFKRMVPIAFADGSDIPPLLGRLGFMEIFDVLFSKKHKVIFKE